MADVERVELVERFDQCDQLCAGVRPRIRREHAVGVGQEQELLGAEKDRHLSREKVVVAE